MYKSKSGNHVAGTADRSKNKNMSESADPRTTLFTYNERSERRWRSRELSLVCVRKKVYGGKRVLVKVAGEVTQARSKAGDPNGVTIEPKYSYKTHFLCGEGSCGDRYGK